MKKTIAKFIAAALALATTVSLVACGGGNNSDKDKDTPGKQAVPPEVTVTEKAQTYVMEAEYIDLTDVKGSGLSNAASGVDMITGTGTEADIKKGWSSGYYVSQMHAEDCTLVFEFNARAAENVAIDVRMSSELGTLSFTPESLVFTLNGTELPYGTFTVTGSEQDLQKAVFNDFRVAASVKLKKDKNTFTVRVKRNALRGDGNPAGPLVDCVKLTTKSVITFTEHKDNIDKRDNPNEDM